MIAQKHNTFLCPSHVDDCECDPKDEFVCNPYCVLEYCPTDGEGEKCSADPERLIKVKAGTGYTWAIIGG